MKLITFDRTKNINYFGECKLQFNGPDKCLYLKMLDKDPEETMTATFNRIFICKSNLLCSMNQNSNNSMILVFSTKDKCERIFKAIIKVKSRQPLTNKVVIDEDEAFKENFFLPLIKAVQSGINGFQDLKIIILGFVDSLEVEERISYLITFLLTPNSSEEKVKDKPDITLSFVNPSVPETLSSVSNIENLKSLSKCKTRKRNNISCKENDEIPRKKSNVSICNKSSNVFCLDEPTPQNSPDDVIFDIVEFLQNGKIEKKLLVFTSNEPKQCYEFILSKRTHWFRCIKCLAQKRHTVIKATICNDGSQTFDFNVGDHVCQPINFLPQNYKSSLIIKPPNFKMDKHKTQGKIYPLLIIFDSADKNMCYRFGFDCTHNFYYCCTCKRQGRTVTARFIQHDGNTAVELGSLEHLCKPVKYIPYGG